MTRKPKLTRSREAARSGAEETVADIGADIDPEVAQALIDLIEMGLVVDSGLRRNGRIVWCAVPEMATFAPHV